jgi:type IX secretion system PorP/SprF family membrane protein
LTTVSLSEKQPGMKSIRRITFFVLLSMVVSVDVCFGQQVPDFPVSYRIYNPFIFNPAIAGSKDFTSADLLISSFGNSNSQLASGNLRISKSEKEYFSSLPTPEFTKIGVGGYLFNDKNDSSRSIGFGASGSYHLQLDKNALSFLSFGLSVKAVSNDYEGNSDLNKPAEKTFFPNIDAGVYFYTSGFYAGISATNILGNPNEPDTLGYYTIPCTRQFFLHGGYKFVLSRSLNILLEPFLIVNSDDSFSGKISEMLKPGLKVYAGNFCLGTYFNDFDNISFMLQYKYSKLYIGTYFEMTYKEPFYKQPILAEIAIGVNLSAIKSGFPRRNHW